MTTNCREWDLDEWLTLMGLKSTSTSTVTGLPLEELEPGQLQFTGGQWVSALNGLRCRPNYARTLAPRAAPSDAVGLCFSLKVWNPGIAGQLACGILIKRDKAERYLKDQAPLFHFNPLGKRIIPLLPTLQETSSTASASASRASYLHHRTIARVLSLHITTHPDATSSWLRLSLF